METLTRSASIHYRCRRWREAGASVALVPTRGTLHKGHMSLIAGAQDIADHVVVSLFADPERHAGHDADLELLAKIGAEIVFLPPVQEMFPIGVQLSGMVSVPELADELEGADRPGHMAAGLTLLVKLINLTRPHFAVFGERDFQQLVMLRRLVEDLFLAVDVVSRPTWRESDGLALASINRQLTQEQRALAPQLYATLSDIARQLDAGDVDYAALQRRGVLALDGAGFATEYVAIRRAADLGPVVPGTRELVILAAVRLGAIRLTDSYPLRLIERH
jgi:pantoate--beta-alanine ligase